MYFLLPSKKSKTHYSVLVTVLHTVYCCDAARGTKYIPKTSITIVHTFSNGIVYKHKLGIYFIYLHIFYVQIVLLFLI